MSVDPELGSSFLGVHPGTVQALGLCSLTLSGTCGLRIDRWVGAASPVSSLSPMEPFTVREVLLRLCKHVGQLAKRFMMRSGVGCIPVGENLVNDALGNSARLRVPDPNLAAPCSLVCALTPASPTGS